MKLNSFTSVLLILWVTLHVCFAQEKAQAGCILINENLHAVSIRYAKPDKANGQYKEDNEIFLQLYNNTNCPIYVRTETSIITETKQGKTTDIADGVVRKIEFLIQEKEQEKESREFYKWSDSKVYSRLLGGRSLFFGVPVEVFISKNFVIVPFFYEWDFPGDISSVKHQAIFYYGNVPSIALYQK